MTPEPQPGPLLQETRRPLHAQRSHEEPTQFTVKLLCNDEEGDETITLPFPPFVGLNLQLPWRQGDYGEVDEVYWDHETARFEVFFKPHRLT